jgi:hypothetical protein
MIVATEPCGPGGHNVCRHQHSTPAPFPPHPRPNLAPSDSPRDTAGALNTGGDRTMKTRSAIRATLIALVALVGSSATSQADSGSIRLTIYKAGWIIGGSGGSGVLNFHGRGYPLSTGGLDYGLLFGGSKTVLHGTVRNIYRPSDVAGVYGAAGAGLAVGQGARAIVLTNQKGAVLELTGRQVGLMANLDLSGLAITLK